MQQVSIILDKKEVIVMVKFVNDKKIIVVIPNHKEIDPGILLSIIGQSRMTKEEFLNQY